MDLMIAGRPTPIELTVFDCDGVLLASMDAKVEAFRRWVPVEHRACADAFMRMIHAGFGRSRETHIRRFYTELAGVDISGARLADEVDRFTAICEPLCADAGWIAGSREFVARCRDAGVPRYVLSGTPQAPLEAMLAANDGAGLFDRVIGSPPDKKVSLDRILAETGLPPERTIFVGDAAFDAEAAAHAGVHFVYLPSLADPPRGDPATTVTSLTDLLPA